MIFPSQEPFNRLPTLDTRNVAIAIACYFSPLAHSLTLPISQPLFLALILTYTLMLCPYFMSNRIIYHGSAIELWLLPHILIIMSIFEFGCDGLMQSFHSLHLYHSAVISVSRCQSIYLDVHRSHTLIHFVEYECN